MAAPSIFVFNEAYCLGQNPDVAAALAAGATQSGLAHRQAFGQLPLFFAVCTIVVR